MPERRPRLEGKVAIVTGAGSSGPGIGTGKATSVLFAREGARVLLVDQVATHAEETLVSIREEGGDASVFEADVINPADCQAMVDTARARYGRLDILVNNVGILGSGSVVDVKEDDWDRVLDVNLKGMMLTSKYAIPAMIEGGGGAIVNISSIAGLRAGCGGASLPYAVSKGGVIALTTQMAVHHGRDNIRVNGIAPGHIYTPVEDLHWLDGETRAWLRLFSEGVASARLLLLVTYRPEFQHGWGSKTYYNQLLTTNCGSTRWGLRRRTHC